MRMASTVRGLFCFIVLGLVAASDGKVLASNKTDLLLYRTLSALGSALDFFRKEYRNINLDAVIGTRMVEGTLKVLLRKQDIQKIDASTVQKIQDLSELAEHISDDATPFVAEATPDYFKRIGAILAPGFWELDYPSRDLDPTIPIWEYKLEESMHEQTSDDCLAEFFGTGKKSKEKCRISNKCWRLMTKNGYSGYSLSHEIFYLEIGEQFGCLPQMIMKILSRRQESLDEQREKFCANMLAEARLLADNGFPATKQDLFMEQAALCGMLGYRQFITSDWLEKMLSWQDLEVGCFRGSSADGLGVDTVHFKRNPLRVKREEKRLSDGCLCHRTTVAAAALAQYVRFIIEVKLTEMEHGIQKV